MRAKACRYFVNISLDTKRYSLRILISLYLKRYIKYLTYPSSKHALMKTEALLEFVSKNIEFLHSRHVCLHPPAQP